MTMPVENYVYPGKGNLERDEARYLPMPEGDSKRTMRAALKEVENIVCGSRQDAYGPPEVNHGRTAQLWTTYLGVPISPRQVCLMNALQKISRDVNLQKADNLTDLMGYAVNAVACEAAAGVNGI